MITVYGRATSSNVQAVMWAAAEVGLEVDRINLGHSFGGLDTPEYLAMNPNGRIPVLRDGDGPPLFESAAIVRYLAARYGDEQFWSPDPATRAPQDMWAEWIKTTFGPTFIRGIFWAMMAADAEPAGGAEKFAVAEAEVAHVAQIANNAIKGRDYLGGEAPCFADIVFGSLLYRYFTLAFERAETPDLSAYYDRLTTRPAYCEHVMVSYDVLRKKS